jgi:hypothetical protein
MHKKIIILAIALMSVKVTAQKLHEIGVFVGAGYYLGEINQSTLFKSPQPAISILYKVDFSERYALRISGTYAKFSGSDAGSTNGYQLDRNHSFNISASEFAALLEFNFLPYKPASRFEYFSPYVALGTGVLLIPAEEGKLPIHPIIPFGVGFKYAFNKRFGIAAEWTFRKTFTDFIDQLPEQEYTEVPVIENKQRTYGNSKDWYSFAGITLTYKFALGSGKCPAYGN